MEASRHDPTATPETSDAGTEHAADSDICPECGVRHGAPRLAGMALANGVMVLGPTHWAAAVRADSGEIVRARGRRPSASPAIDRVPLVRGAVRLTEMLAVLPLVRRALPQARFSFEAPKVLAGTLAGSIATRGLRRRYGERGGVELASSALSLGALLAAMRGGETASYHGAEHKVIGGYERGIPAEQAPKEHPRCGTQLAVPLLVMNAVGFEAARFLLPGRLGLARWVGLASGVGAAVEIARGAQRGGANQNLIGRIGHEIQATASTSEPTAAQLEVAQAALDELLAAEDLPAAAVAASG